MTRAWTLGLALALIVAIVVSVPAFAQEATPDAAATPATCPNFVDADGDGVCDHAEAGMCPGAGHHAQMNRGRGMHMGMGYNGMGQNFVDEDGDGICDNCPTDDNGAQSQMGGMGHMGRAAHQGRHGFWFWR